MNICLLLGDVTTTGSVDSTTTMAEKRSQDNNVSTSTASDTQTLGVSSLCEKECTITYGKEKEENMNILSHTEGIVQDE